MLARVSESVPPEPLIVRAVEPPTKAPTVTVPPVFVAVREVALRTPVVPVMEPPETVTAPSAEAKVTRSSVPPPRAYAPWSAVVVPAWIVPASRTVPPE